MRVPQTPKYQKDFNEMNGAPGTKVDFSKLKMNTLHRYGRYYKLKSKKGLTKRELAKRLADHFHSMDVAEEDTVKLFIQAVGLKKNKLDLAIDSNKETI